jgi:6-carboxyhexanoate--CoA ligase
MLIFAKMKTIYYSIRMHAERDSRHLSGGERLVPTPLVESVSAELLRRAMLHFPGVVKVSIDEVCSDQIVFGPIPEITVMPQCGYEQGRKLAVAALFEAGVSEHAALSAMAVIATGASLTGDAMRGAMLIDSLSGKRLEADQDRGVRATRFDLTAKTSDSLTRLLKKNGLHHLRTHEALVLAAKVMAAPDIVAELCWSDAADYTAGYVASRQTGYRRFTDLKKYGDLRGGRAFFVRPGADLAATIAFLEQTPFLADRHGVLSKVEGEQ